jgi:tetratricopeptide (TPR) repeat protein
MRTTVPWKWWWFAFGLVIAAGVFSRDRAGLIAAAIVAAGMLIWSGWPVVHARFCLGRLGKALERENAAEARRWLERLPSYDSSYGRAYVKIAEAAILSLDEKYGVARLVLSEIVRAGPRLEVVRQNALAWCEAHDGAAEAAVPRAEATLERARLQYPGMVSYCLGTLGAARVLAGKSGDAIEPLQQALAAGKPPRAQAIRAYYLGEAYRAGSRTDDALAAYERARRESPTSRWAQKAADRAQELAKASPYR